MSKRWIAGQIVTALSAALGLAFDATGYSPVGDAIPPWQIVALIAFVAFAVLSGLSQWSMYREVHEPESMIVADVRRDPMTPGQPFHRMSVDAGDRLLGAVGAMRLSLRNRDVHPRSVTGLRLEFWTSRRWYWPFSRLILPPLMPSPLNPIQQIIGNHYVRSFREVDWQFAPASPTFDYHVFFQYTYPRENPGPKINKRLGYRAVFVVEVGAPDHVKRITLPDLPPLELHTSAGQP